MNCTFLMEEVGKHEVLLSKFSKSVTNEKKKLLWDDITAKVNSVSAAERTVDEDEGNIDFG